MSAAALPRKPLPQNVPQRCYCRHTEHQHQHHGACSRCECTRFEARPCVCGHPAELHRHNCSEPGCACRSFREDRTTEFLLRAGVRAGEWQFITDQQLVFPKLPHQLDITRVWACGMSHAIGQQSQLAVKTNAAGRKAPLSPNDIVRELNALDTSGIGAMTKQSVRRALEVLERFGVVRREGDTKGAVSLYFYEKPQYQEYQEYQMVVKSDYQNESSDSNESTSDSGDVNPSSTDRISHFCGVLVKSFLTNLRKDLRQELAGQKMVAESDYHSVLTVLLDELQKVASDVYLRAIEVVKYEASTRTRASQYPASSSEELIEELSSSSSESVQPGRQAPETTATTTTNSDSLGDRMTESDFADGLRALFLSHKKPPPTGRQIAATAAALPPSALGPYLDDIRRRVSRMEHPGALKTDVAAFAAAWRAREQEQAQTEQVQEDQPVEGPEMTGGHICALVDRGVVFGSIAYHEKWREFVGTGGGSPDQLRQWLEASV